MHRSIRFVVPLAALALASSGCLSSSHRIPNSELQRLAQTDPKARGEHVRVIQAFVNDDNPPGAPRVRGGAVIVVDGGGHHHGGHGGGKKVNSKKLGKLKADKAKDLIILAAVIAIGVAATEGARYDGWVKVHPMHPVHLYGPNGEYSWVPLAQLDVETARWARRAYIRPSEGPWNELGRAPLNRRGWTYSVLLGGGQIHSNADDTDETGFLSHIQFGYFPTKQVGFLFDTAYGWREDSFGNTIFDVRYGLELQAMVLKAGKIHAGGFGNIGSAKLFDDFDGNDRVGIAFAGGAILQLELTTRLAITARAGVAQVHDKTVQDFTLGVSIY